jgi:hypothetical protein
VAPPWRDGTHDDASAFAVRRFSAGPCFAAASLFQQCEPVGTPAAALVPANARSTGLRVPGVGANRLPALKPGEQNSYSNTVLGVCHAVT